MGQHLVKGMGMSTILVTGANRGIGLEFVRQYSKMGWRVLATTRDLEKSKDLVALSYKKQAGQIEVSVLDVGDLAAIEAMAQKYRDENIDILVNNAGIFGPEVQSFGKVDYLSWSEAFWVNAIAPMKMAEQFSRQVARSDKKLILNLSTHMGSIAENESGGFYIYRSSKAALNAITKSMAIDLKHIGITVIAIHPGWVKTDMGGEGATRSVEDSVETMRKAINMLEPEDSGRFMNLRGEAINW